MEERTYRRRQRSNPMTMYLVLIALFLFLTFSLIIKGCIGTAANNTQNNGPILSTNPLDNILPTETTPPGEVYLLSSATIGVTGDIMGHGPVLNSVLNENGEYDFSECFRYVAPLFKSYDLMVANLEVTMGGTEAGEYRGYPTFNCPDSIVDALKGAGIDMVTTATNHSYDTGTQGFHRTQEVLSQKGMLYIGTRPSEDAPKYIVQDLNGIKVGMACYTYEHEQATGPEKNLNGIKMSNEDAPLINSFNYRNIDAFYSEVESVIADMKNDGAQVVIFYMHWGNEYEQTASNTQKKMSQQLSNRGVDVIVGGHPHVVQPMAVLNGENGNKTLCFYSTGNCISNQRRYEINRSPNGHTEDGIIFSFQLSSWSDGTVTITDVAATPLWVSLDKVEDKSSYTITPVDITYKALPAISRFADTINGIIDPDREPTAIEAFVPGDESQISSSFNRTSQGILSSLNDVRRALGLLPVTNTAGK